jgi:hypothetical protein
MLRFSVSSDVWWRLPRHPDWKYEMVKGEAWLSSRPRPLHLCRSTSLEVQAVTLSGVEIRRLDAGRDRAEIAKLLMDVWVQEDPYRSLEDPESLLQAEIERSLNEPSLAGIVAVDKGTICAVVLVGTDAAGVPGVMLASEGSPPLSCALSWKHFPPAVWKSSQAAPRRRTSRACAGT